MILVDTWRVYKRRTFGGDEKDDDDTSESQKQFYGHLAAEMIDNTYDRAAHTRSRTEAAIPAPHSCDAAVINLRTSHSRCGELTDLTPTKRKKRLRDGTETKYCLQDRCRNCGDKTRYCCSACLDDPDRNNEGWLCHTKKGKMCFPAHLASCHSN